MLTRSTLLLVLGSLVLLPVTPRAETVSGRVYLDSNANGQWDRDEDGLAKVRITDGVHFVTTDTTGRYTLRMADDPVLGDGGVATVSLCIPSGYWPTSPWFVRTLDLTEGRTANFGLRRDRQKLPFTFVHATDPHVPRQGEQRFARFRQDAATLPFSPAFCLLTGDVSDLSDSHSPEKALSEYEFLAEQIRDFPLPLFGLPGNHDLAGVRSTNHWDRQGPLYAYGAFTRYVGPLRWSFDYADIHFVGLDFNTKTNGVWGWGVPDAALDWFEQDLNAAQEADRIYLFVHYPQGSDRFKELLRTGRVTQVFHGHDHRDRAYQIGGIPCLSSASLSEVFADKDRWPGYRLVHVRADGFESFYRATGDPHAITLDYPRASTGWDARQEVLRGAFYDPAAKIQQLSIAIGGRKFAIPFRRGPLACRFEASFVTAALPEFRPSFTIELTDGQQSWRQSYTNTPPALRTP